MCLERPVTPYPPSHRVSKRLLHDQRPFTSLSLTLLYTLLLAGCGDVRGSNALTLTVDGRGSSYLALQDGLGPWRPLALGDTQTVTLTGPEGRYGLLSVCSEGETGNLSVDVQHGVVGDVPAVSAGCTPDEPPPAAPVRLTGAVAGLAAGAYGNLYLGDASVLVDSAAPTGRLELPAARYDLVASRYSGSARVPDRLVLEPDLDLSRSRVVNIDFGGPLAFSPKVRELELRGVRPGELLSGSVELLTAGGTSALLGEYTGGTTLPYADVPRERLRGLRLRAEAQSFTYDDRTKAGSSRSLSRTLAGDAVLTLPAPLGVPKLELKGVGAVRPEARWRAYRAGGGVYAQFYSQIRGGRAVSYRLSQSSAWLAGGPLVYALPDFSALAGWDPAWNLIPGQELFWDVSFARTTPLQELFVSRSGVLLP